MKIICIFKILISMILLKNEIEIQMAIDLKRLKNKRL